MAEVAVPARACKSCALCDCVWAVPKPGKHPLSPMAKFVVVKVIPPVDVGKTVAKVAF